MSSGASRIRVVVEVEVPEGDEEGVYREEFCQELAKRILNILLDRETMPAREAVEEVLRVKENQQASSHGAILLRV